MPAESMIPHIEYKARLVFIPGQDKPLDACGCHFCETEWRNTMRDLDPDWWAIGAFMILCESCGNKRCPRATYHGHACTGSNEPGQPLSVYGDFRLPNQRQDEDSDDTAAG
ncbi:hypothetical protein [Prescottella equi]|uniref:hypothetical protein n=1 Tax=Rhodococcus hoagii TaxID=43767 RepID=UPI001EEAF962|nr:hypothetical protein [Prescottella equi]